MQCRSFCSTDPSLRQLFAPAIRASSVDALFPLMYAENMSLPYKTGNNSQSKSKYSANSQPESKTKTKSKLKTNPEPDPHSESIAQTGPWTKTKTKPRKPKPKGNSICHPAKLFLSGGLVELVRHLVDLENISTKLIERPLIQAMLEDVQVSFDRQDGNCGLLTLKHTCSPETLPLVPMGPVR
jgi:hypothetical protein